MTNKIIKFGIIGTGRVGVDWHYRDICAAGAKVLAFSDTAKGRAEKYANKFGVQKYYDDYMKLLEDVEIDAVAICTPPVSHEKIAVEAFARGKHVYLEKPPAMNHLQMININDAAKKSGKVFYVGSNNVYSREIQLIKKIIDSNEIGEIYHIECQKIIGRSYLKAWHTKKNIAGGGVGMNSIPHRLDWVLYLLEVPKAKSVTAISYNNFIDLNQPETMETGYKLMDVAEGIYDRNEKRDVEDSIVAMIRLENNCDVYIRDFSSANMADEFLIKIYGTKGGIKFNHAGLNRESGSITLYKQFEDGNVHEEVQDIIVSNEGAHVAVYKEFLKSIQTGERIINKSGYRSIELMRIIDSIYESAANDGKQIRVD